MSLSSTQNTGMDLNTLPRFYEYTVKKLRSTACSRQKNAISSSHIHRTWEAYFSPCLYTNIPFSENLQSLSERLIGPFDIEDVVDPIGVSISEGIMNFQNSGYEITGKVFQDCGTPRLQKRQVGCKTIHFLG